MFQGEYLYGPPLPDEPEEPELRVKLRCYHCARSFPATIPESELVEYVFNERDGTYSGDGVLCPQCERDDQAAITRDWCR